jgi:predicted amino acid-binding ACT domain protein
MMKAVSSSETSVNIYQITRTASQETAIFQCVTDLAQTYLNINCFKKEFSVNKWTAQTKFKIQNTELKVRLRCGSETGANLRVATAKTKYL